MVASRHLTICLPSGFTAGCFASISRGKKIMERMNTVSLIAIAGSAEKKNIYLEWLKNAQFKSILADTLGATLLFLLNLSAPTVISIKLLLIIPFPAYSAPKVVRIKDLITQR